ncbi:MAG: hypothetical protein ABUL62_03050 [Myxococcales bacterium]
MRFLRPVETPGAEVAAFTSALLIAQQVAGKATRDALFLSEFQTSRLPVAMAVGALLSLGAVFWLSRMMARKSPAAIMPWLSAISAALFTGEWLLGLSAPKATAVCVYLHTALLGPATISTFWSLINEAFDPHTAKRAVSRIAAGGTLGGVLGGLASWRASTVVQPLTLLLILAALNGLSLIGTSITVRRWRATAEQRSSAQRPSEEEPVSAYRALRDMPFLRNLAILVALGAATSAILDYVFSTQAVAAFGKGAALLSFFSLFWLGVGLLSFLLQLSAGRIALEKLGVAVNIAVLPGLIVLGGAFGLAVPGLASASSLRAADAVQRNTLFRSAYELLYTPIPEARKRATKALIDVGCDRLGTMLGSGVALLAIALAAHGAGPVLLGVVVVLALATLPVTRQLHVGYVAALREGLSEGAAALRIPSADERASSSLVAKLDVERDRLIDRIEELQPGGLSAMLDATGAAGESKDDARAPSTSQSGRGDRELIELQSLLSTDANQAERALASLSPRGAGVGLAIGLLGDDLRHKAALRALSGIAESITGQLLDWLLDDETDFVVRRRIPHALRACATQRAADGLLLGVADARFEVRYACGRALLALTELNSGLVVSREKVIEAVQRELSSERQAFVELEAELNEDGDASIVGSLVRDRADRSLDHVFTLLSLHLEREPLRMAFRALHHPDTAFRGTALEYLDTVLPPEIRPIVWPFLGEAAPLPTARTPRELLTALAQAG